MVAPAPAEAELTATVVALTPAVVELTATDDVKVVGIVEEVVGVAENDEVVADTELDDEASVP